MLGEPLQEQINRLRRARSPHLRHGISLSIRVNQFVIIDEVAPCLRLVTLGDELLGQLLLELD